MLPLLLAAILVANDSIVYPVLNHGRVAGAMTVVRRGDTVTVRYVFTDRNRGTRIETRSAVQGGLVRWMETRPVLANDQLGELTMRVEIAGDSLRRTSATRTSTEKIPAGTIFTQTPTPLDQARLAAYLLKQPNTTVIIRGDRIVDVGPAETTVAPAGATMIDATGKTVMAGLWDMHGHLQMTSQSSGSVSQLSYGLTTVRDLAADLDVAVSHRDRAQAGQLASPRQVLGGFIEGPLKWAGPTEVLVATEPEARQWVARYDSLGYKQVKLYNVVHPDVVPAIVDEAHKRGMRVSGHIPRGLSVPAAVKLGFDEVNHAAFLFSTFYQDSLYWPTMRAYSLVASTVAPNIDVDGQPMTDLIALLKANNTVIDGTFSVWITSAGTGIAQAVGAGTPSNASKADSNYYRLIKRLYDAGVTLVPGTDNLTGSSYNTELEVYERAGLPAPFVLQMATITSARVMKDEKDYGSITAGKVADIIVVNGKPAERVSELRKVELVLRGGRLFDIQELKAATGRR